MDSLGDLERVARSFSGCQRAENKKNRLRYAATSLRKIASRRKTSRTTTRETVASATDQSWSLASAG